MEIAGLMRDCEPSTIMITIGRVVKPQGRKGEVLVQPLSDRPDRFPTLRRVFVPGARGGGARGRRSTACWPHKGRFVLKLEGVDSIDEAERLPRASSSASPRTSSTPCPPGSYYHYQLHGLDGRGRGGRGRSAPSTTSWRRAAEAPVLVVRGPERASRCVPLADDFITPGRPGARAASSPRRPELVDAAS